MSHKNHPPVKNSSLLSKYTPPSSTFEEIDTLIDKFRTPAFLKLNLRQRFRQVNQTLAQLILDAPPQAFLLKPVLNFFDRINKENILNDLFNFSSFEFWLNLFSGFSEKENYAIRAKIVGKHLPREEYQSFFPIGMGKTYFGTHFVAAHLSPDIDTMIASFWGWIDAFAARVGSGLHLWCLPDGPPDSPTTSFFRDLIDPTVFSYAARTIPTLTLTAMDLVTQKQLTKELGNKSIDSIHDGSSEKAVILVNEQGHYLGDWRHSDIEPARQIIILFKACLHWFENNLQINLISLFAKKNLSTKDFKDFNSSIFDVQIKDCSPVQEFNKKQQDHLNNFIQKVFGVEEGLNGTFRDLNRAFQHLSITKIFDFQTKIEELSSSHFFDQNGTLSEERSQIFNFLKTLVKHLDEAMFELRTYVERLDVFLKIKYDVLKTPQIYLTLRSDVDEIRQKMEHHDFLTVVIHEHDCSLFPVGIIQRTDLREKGLGTVSLRDFCNLDEVRMASYLEVISVIDHHKCSLKTPSVPMALIGDAQSCNVLIAEKAFEMNDKFSLGGISSAEIDTQIEELSSQLTTASPSKLRILQRLLQKRLIANENHSYYVHPTREYTEYLCFLQAILDDTDLLTKVSNRDVTCMMQLLNRLKSLSLKREVEIIDFDDIPKGENFAKAAAKKILQQPDMYSLYKHIYSLRESEVDSNLTLCAQGLPSNIFVDTKEQNGCTRVGQTKLFASNFPLFLEKSSEIRQLWLSQSQALFEKKPEIDLFIHMISTIASAEEVHKDKIAPYHHQDELWLWTPPTQAAYRHLHHFLSGFQSPMINFKAGLSIEFLNSPSDEFIHLFDLHFPEVPKVIAMDTSDLPMAVLRFKAGALNSRKSMITPYLPKLI